jgi:hypothetical protein
MESLVYPLSFLSSCPSSLRLATPVNNLHPHSRLSQIHNVAAPPLRTTWLAVLSTTDMSSLAAAKEAGPPLPTMSSLSNRNGDDHGAWLGERRGRRHQHFGLAGPVDRGPYV